jgi:hypothetical protein
VQNARISRRYTDLRIVFHRLVRTVVLVVSVLFERTRGERPQHIALFSSLTVLKFDWLIKQHNVVLILVPIFLFLRLLRLLIAPFQKVLEVLNFHFVDGLRI